MMTQLTENATELTPAGFDSVTNCLVLAPHPDDESLGCGGLISLLRKQSKEVNVIFITDGSLSHPNSKQYPSDKLAALRKQEAVAALGVLGVTASNIFFMNKKDGSLPSAGETGFVQNAGQLHLIIALLQPDLVLVPYEKDPHRDHHATWQMLMHLHEDIHASYHILEYLVWLPERGEDGDMPDKKTMRYVNITPYQTEKKEAIYRHVSQTTPLISDDPHGFTLSEDMLRRFDSGTEFYIDRGL